MKRSIPFGRPRITYCDREAVLDVLNGHILTHGPMCKAFEEKFAKFMGDPCYCVTVSSCMAALHLAYLQMGIGPGDEVLVPAQTHIATAHSIEILGATPVFVDCNYMTGNIETSLLKRFITSKTKAISVVHFLGIPCDMDSLMAIARSYNLKVVEDCALALGARFDGKHVGLFGDAGCFSFYPIKHITAGEGGMFVTRHKFVAEEVAKLRGFGIDKSYFDRKISGLYDVTSLGLNYRMSEIQAALGHQQISCIQEIIAIRRRNFALLKSLLDSDDLCILDNSDNPKIFCSYYCLSIVLDGLLAQSRNSIIRKLNAKGVGTSIYYPHPVPRMSYYKGKYGFESAKYTNAINISDRSISLPIGQHITEADVVYIAKCVKQILAEMSHVKHA